jgi:hypothetical protein
MTLLSLALLGCAGPYDAVADREAAWWGPVAELEQREGLTLADLPDGEPVGYWPRVVLHADRIAVDNRAWFLSLPEPVFETLEERERAELLVEADAVVPLDAGVVPESDKRGQLIDALYAELLDIAERHKALADPLGDAAPPFDGRLIVVPHADTPMLTLREVLFTASQAQFSGVAVAGDASGRLRSAMALAGTECHLQAYPGSLEGTPTIPLVRTPVREVCEQGVEGLVAVVERCRSRWEAVAASSGTAFEGACVQVSPVIGRGTAGVVLPRVAAWRAHHPVVQTGYWVGGVDAEDPDGDEEDEPHCEGTIPLADLSEPELDALCRSAEIVEDPTERARDLGLLIGGSIRDDP